MEQLGNSFIAWVRANGYFYLIFIGAFGVISAIWFFMPSICSPVLVVTGQKIGARFYLVYRAWLLLTLGNILSAIIFVYPPEESRLFIGAQILSSFVVYSYWFPHWKERIDPERVHVEYVMKLQYLHFLWTLVSSAFLTASLSVNGMLGVGLRVFTLDVLPMLSAIGWGAFVLGGKRFRVSPESVSSKEGGSPSRVNSF